ncbi:MAG: thiamine pyrophosphate-dependent enzyme [Treponemataceae bacterium]|nr:thiamine pyrophosphate-dependent enzyme [Treponemataceae bacterium]
MIEATGAQIIVKLLQNQGISLVSGIPGASVLPLYNELATSSITHVLARHEQGAGFLAQGIARSTGLPAVCLTTSGAGVMNLLTAVADAKADSIPLIAITGQVASGFIGTDAFQEADTFGLSLPITKHSVLVKDAAELLEVIPKAFAIASSGRPGPVIIDVPVDVQTQKISFEEWPATGNPLRKAARLATAKNELSERMEFFARTLLDAKRPMLFVGGGCRSLTAAMQIERLLKTFSMPVASSFMGLGTVNGNNPAFYGMTGIFGHKAANSLLQKADVVLVVGVRFDERAVGYPPMFNKDAVILHIDIDAAEINKIVAVQSSVTQDAETALPLLSEALALQMKERGMAPAENDVPLADEEPSELPSGLLARAESVLRGSAQIQHFKQPVQNPVPELWAGGAEKDKPDCTGEKFAAHVAATARKLGFCGDNLIVTTDVGQHQMWVARQFIFEKPRQFLSSGSLGTMGFGLPVAIGAAFANPGKRVLCMSGDGSLLMNVQELATLADFDLDVTVIVFDNKALGMVKQLQVAKRKKQFAVTYPKSTNYKKLAESFGISAMRIDGRKVKPGDDWESFAFPQPGSGPRLIQVMC